MRGPLRKKVQAFRLFGCLVAVLAGCVLPAFPSNVCGRLDEKSVNGASVSSFRERTEAAVESLRMISEALKNNQTGIATGLVQQAQDSWCELQMTSEYFRLMAERQADLCQSRVTELIDRINVLYVNQKGLEATLGQLRADLAEAVLDDQLTSAELAKIQATIAENQRDLAERQRKLQELRDWWWVPGYGLYLAIRTAVDNDEARARSLVVDLDKLQGELSRNAAHVNGLRQLNARLETEAETAQWSGDSLNQMRDDLHGKLGTRKGAVVFFVEARSFWDQVRRIDLDSVGSTLSFIQELQRDLDSEVSVSLLGEEKQTLMEELDSFAAAIDTNKKFLFGEGFDLCPSDVPVSCGYGYALEDGFCWANCPPGFTLSGKVCIKPKEFVLTGNRQLGEYWELEVMKSDVASIRADYMNLEQEIQNTTDDYDREMMRENQQFLKEEVGLMTTQRGLNLCREVYKGRGGCEIRVDGWGWEATCPRNHAKLYPPRVRSYPPPPPSPPFCIPQCPPKMADLGSTCGRDFYAP